MGGGWTARLRLHDTRDGGRTVGRDRHEGPLRVRKALHPEGPGSCHHVLVHPPGGIVGGDQRHVDARLDAGRHARITTPAATRFCRSACGVPGTPRLAAGTARNNERREALPDGARALVGDAVAGGARRLAAHRVGPDRRAAADLADLGQPPAGGGGRLAQG